MVEGYEDALMHYFGYHHRVDCDHCAHRRALLLVMTLMRGANTAFCDLNISYVLHRVKIEMGGNERSQDRRAFKTHRIAVLPNFPTDEFLRCVRVSQIL